MNGEDKKLKLFSLPDHLEIIMKRWKEKKYSVSTKSSIALASLWEVGKKLSEEKGHESRWGRECKQGWFLPELSTNKIFNWN